MLILLTSLVSMSKIQKTSYAKVRLHVVRMISAKTKESFLATIYEYGLFSWGLVIRKAGSSSRMLVTQLSCLYVGRIVCVVVLQK